nr:MAG TPA: hypothetical protein [Caudoviricetes sp.]
MHNYQMRPISNHWLCQYLVLHLLLLHFYRLHVYLQLPETL